MQTFEISRCGTIPRAYAYAIDYMMGLCGVHEKTALSTYYMSIAEVQCIAYQARMKLWSSRCESMAMGLESLAELFRGLGASDPETLKTLDTWIVTAVAALTIGAIGLAVYQGYTENSFSRIRNSDRDKETEFNVIMRR